MEEGKLIEKYERAAALEEKKNLTLHKNIEMLAINELKNAGDEVEMEYDRIVTDAAELMKLADKLTNIEGIMDLKVNDDFMKMKIDFERKYGEIGDNISDNMMRFEITKMKSVMKFKKIKKNISSRKSQIHDQENENKKIRRKSSMTSLKYTSKNENDKRKMALSEMARNSSEESGGETPTSKRSKISRSNKKFSKLQKIGKKVRILTRLKSSSKKKNLKSGKERRGSSSKNSLESLKLKAKSRHSQIFSPKKIKTY